MKADEVFVGAKLKIERAIRHIEELHVCLKAFSKEDFFTVAIDEQPVNGGYYLRFYPKGEMWADFPLIIGDVTHNLSNALDYLTSEIVALKGVSGDKRTTFPTHESREQLARSSKGGTLEKAAPEILKFIIDEIRPYKDGNYDIWALRKLDNADKHRLLTPVARVTELHGFSAEDGSGPRYMNNSFIVRGNNVLVPFNVGPDFRIIDMGTPHIDIVFAKDQFFEGASVLEVVNRLTEVVADAVVKIEDCYLNNSSLVEKSDEQS